MQSSPTSVSQTIVNNPPCYFSGEWDITSSISTSSFKLKNTSKEKLISFLCLFSNCNRSFFFPTKSCTHPTTSFLVLLILPSPVIFYNSTDVDFTTDPKPDFHLVLLLHLYTFCNCDNRWAHGGLGLGAGLRGGLTTTVGNSELVVDFLCEKSFQQKNISKQKISLALRTNNYSLRESYSTSPRNPHSFTCHI